MLQRTRRTVFIGFIVFLSLSTQTFAFDAIKPEPPLVSAKRYLVMDYDTGKVVFHSQGFKRSEPASITKVMTSYIIFDRLKKGKIRLNDITRVSPKARYMIGSRSFLEAGSEVSVDQLLKGMLIQSGNDSAVALAEYLAGSEEKFVKLMNRTARHLQMRHTHFGNATGMPQDNHYTTAYDLALLGQQIIKKFPKFYHYFSITKFTYNNITQKNRNLLLFSDHSVDGIKSGHTERAGFCLLASAKRGDRRLISVVLDDYSSKAREASSKALLDYGFKILGARQSKQDEFIDNFHHSDDE